MEKSGGLKRFFIPFVLFFIYEYMYVLHFSEVILLSTLIQEFASVKAQKVFLIHYYFQFSLFGFSFSKSMWTSETEVLYISFCKWYNWYFWFLDVHVGDSFLGNVGFVAECMWHSHTKCSTSSPANAYGYP